MATRQHQAPHRAPWSHSRSARPGRLSKPTTKRFDDYTCDSYSRTIPSAASE